MEQAPTPNEAIAQIQGLLAEQMVTGSMDSEPNAFQTIIEKLKKGDITPKEAVKEANALVAGRQDYH